MNMSKYPVLLSRDTNGTFLVSFPDVPEAHTFGNTEEDALARAVAAIETALMMYMDDHRPIPAPSPGRHGSTHIVLPALTQAKLALYEAMREQRVTKAELGRRLGWHMPQVDRLLDLGHRSQLDQLEAAFAALNKKLTVHVRDAA